MEHECSNDKCGWFAFNNVPRYVSCPKCGSAVISIWDEQYDHMDDDYEDDEIDPNDE